jgi:hypothetical protein
MEELSAMRFVRAYVRRSTGVVAHVVEMEWPFHERFDFLVAGEGSDLVMHELGLAEDFEATHPVTGAPCSPSGHIFWRIEHIRSAPDAVRGLARFRAKAGLELPAIHEAPTTIGGVLDKLRAGGPAAIPRRVGHWLQFLGHFAHEDMLALGLEPLGIAHAAEFDAMRMRRDPTIRSQLEVFKRQVRERAARRRKG